MVPFTTSSRRRLHAVVAALTGALVLAGAITTFSPLPVVAADEVPVDGTDPGDFSIKVDETIPPAVVSKDSSFATATVVGPHGTAADFVSGRLVLMTDDERVVRSVAERLGAEALVVADPREAVAQLDEQARDDAEKRLGKIWTLTFRPDPALEESAPELLATATGEMARGNYSFSSSDGLATIAQAAALRIEGVPVELDFVMAPDTFRDGVTTEAPTNPGGMVSNSSMWAHLTQIGVPAAWNTLARAGLLNPGSIRVAVLDGGFGLPDVDRAPTAVADPSRPNSVPCSGGSSCPWHGTNVASVLMAQADNGFGSAGPAGPVATPILIDRATVATDVLAGYFRAVGAGGRIVNMSFGADIPAVAAVFTGSVDATMAITSAGGVLNVAAAGNSSKDIDRRDCFIACWEAETVLPCEAVGVTCVGGVQFGTTMPDPGSNWGSGGLNPGRSVDLWASFTALAGPDPAFVGNMTQFTSGTSISSPLVAGVAALARVASPATPVAGIEATLAGTARIGTCSGAGRCASLIVNADAAVSALLGNVPPDVRIVPATTITTPRGVPVTFTAQASDPNGTTPQISWFINGAAVGTGPTLRTGAINLPFGTHRVTARASDGRWIVPDATGGVNLVTYNTAPTTRITSLTDGFVMRSDGWACSNPWMICLIPGLSANTTDVNEPNGISRSAGRWEIDGVIVAYGHDASLPPLSIGTHTVRFVVADPHGATASHQVMITVEPRYFISRP